MQTKLTIRRPDDWHLHLRDGDMLQAVIADTTRHFGRAIVMPNLVPPVVTAAADTSVTVPYLDAVLFMLGIRREDIEAADA